METRTGILYLKDLVTKSNNTFPNKFVCVWLITVNLYEFILFYKN